MVPGMSLPQSIQGCLYSSCFSSVSYCLHQGTTEPAKLGTPFEWTAWCPAVMSLKWTGLGGSLHEAGSYVPSARGSALFSVITLAWAQLFHPPDPDPMLLEVTQQTGYFLKPTLVESSLLRLTEVYCCVMCDILRRLELVCWLLKHIPL